MQHGPKLPFGPGTRRALRGDGQRGSGDDGLNGGGGTDLLDGGAGDDLMDGGSGGDCVLGGDGNDGPTAERGADALFGGAGDDVLDSRTSDDAETGNFSFDRLDGGAGNDTLIRDGREPMRGLESADDFVVLTGVDSTGDLVPGDDRIVIRDQPATKSPPGFEFEPDAADQNVFLAVNGACLAQIKGEFGISAADVIVVPIGQESAPRVRSGGDQTDCRQVQTVLPDHKGGWLSVHQQGHAAFGHFGGQNRHRPGAVIKHDQGIAVGIKVLHGNGTVTGPGQRKGIGPVPSVQMVQRTGHQQVVARATIDEIHRGGRIPVAAIDDVVADPAEQNIGSGPARNGIIAVIAEDPVVAVAALNQVVAVAAIHLIVPGTAAQRVIADMAQHRIVAIVAPQRIVAQIAVQLVRARTADESIVAAAAVDIVIALPPIHQIIGITRKDDIVLAGADHIAFFFAAGLRRFGGIFDVRRVGRAGILVLVLVLVNIGSRRKLVQRDDVESVVVAVLGHRIILGPGREHRRKGQTRYGQTQKTEKGKHHAPMTRDQTPQRP